MNVISTDMEITSEMKKDAETKAKDFLGKTEINEAEVSQQMKEFFDKNINQIGTVLLERTSTLPFLMKRTPISSSL